MSQHTNTDRDIGIRLYSRAKNCIIEATSERLFCLSEDVVKDSIALMSIEISRSSICCSVASTSCLLLLLDYKPKVKLRFEFGSVTAILLMDGVG